MLFLIAWIPVSTKKSIPQAILETTAENNKKTTLDLTKQKCKLINQVSWRRVTRFKISSSRRGRSLGGNNARWGGV